MPDNRPKKSLLQKKPLSVLLGEMEGENRLRRVLGPVQLSSLGVGATIGAGIFVATGVAAHNTAGPALILSYVVAGFACVFAALCYSEFASMVPVAGSAYTYAYATLGELIAWIIGWDLILEYAVSAATVTHGASAYFQNLIGIFKIKLPDALSQAPFNFDPMTGHWVSTGTWLDLPAVVVTAIATVILVIGIRESARFNTAMVVLKVVIVIFVIVTGVSYINAKNWTPFAPYGFSGLNFFGKTMLGHERAGQPVGMLAGAAIIPTGWPARSCPNMVLPKKLSPENPYGANGTQFFAFMYDRPATMTNITITTLRITIAVLKPALSRMPITRITVAMAVTTTVGRSSKVPVDNQWPVIGTKLNGA